MIKKFDSLAPQNILFSLKAHNGGVGGLSLNKKVPNCLATCSEDKTFKIWDIKDDKPTCVFQSDSGNVSNFIISFKNLYNLYFYFILLDSIIYYQLG